MTDIILRHHDSRPWNHENIVVYGYTAWSPHLFNLFEESDPRREFLAFRLAHPEAKIIPWLRFSSLDHCGLTKAKHPEVYDLHSRFYERAMGEGGWLARTKAGRPIQDTPDAPPCFGFSTLRFAENYGTYLVALLGRLRHAKLIDGVVFEDLLGAPPRSAAPCSASDPYQEIKHPRITDLAWKHLTRLVLAKVCQAFGGNFIVSATGTADAPKHLNGMRVEGIDDAEIYEANEAIYYRRDPSYNTILLRGDTPTDIENSLALAALYGHHLVVPGLVNLRGAWPDYFKLGIGEPKSGRIEEGGVVLRRFGCGWATYEPARGIGQVLWNRASDRASRSA